MRQHKTWIAAALAAAGLIAQASAFAQDKHLLAGPLSSTDDGAVVEALGARWPAPAALAREDGRAVPYGIRPGDLTLAAQGIPARVVVVEPTGAETELVLEVGDAGQTASLVLVMHGRTAAKPGDTVQLAIDADKAHVFDGGSAQRL